MSETALLQKRFAELADQLDQVEATKKCEYNGPIRGDFVDGEIFLTWTVKAKSLLASLCGKNSKHYVNFEKNEKATIDSTNYSILRRLKAVFMAAKEDFEGGYLQQPAPEADEWIGAANALELLSMGHSGRTVICKRAHSGLIKARAERLLRDGKILDTVDVFPGFWWAKGEAALEQNWTTGDFDTWIDHKVHLEAFGVTFRRSDIEQAKSTITASPAVDTDGDRMIAGKNIVIGHGHSSLWRELKDFLQGRLDLKVDEFNSVATAGIPTANRLKQMLDNAAFAFLILTAEDEQRDGTIHARLNVVHEAGLFQGRLGFERAIVMLEEGCEEFSNIHGLGQVRFPKGKLKAEFEEVRRVLEREKIIKPQ